MNKLMKIITIENVSDMNDYFFHDTLKKYKEEINLIVSNVKQNGDSALRKYEKKFGNVKIKSFKVTTQEIDNAYSCINKEQISAIKFIKNKLLQTELILKRQFKNINTNNNGLKINRSFIPIASIGCYVPGGLAKYPSSLIMSVVPAKAAGVKKIVVVSPPNVNGNIDPFTLVTGSICGVNEFYKIGGAHAISALAYGTKSIPKVDKIVGPGGLYVTTAKSLVSSDTSIDMIAGPTELGIIADSNPHFVVDDILSQAEHDPNTKCYVLTQSNEIANKIQNILEEKIKQIKKQKIIKSSLKNGFIAVCKNHTQIIDLINKLSPEHLEIITKKPQSIASKITTAGLILLGKDTPSSASDYIFGLNHILPTNGFGKTRGSLSILDFIKLNTKIKSTKLTLKKTLKYVEIFTNIENLPNHYLAIKNRVQ